MLEQNKNNFMYEVDNRHVYTPYKHKCKFVRYYKTIYFFVQYSKTRGRVKAVQCVYLQTRN